MSIFDNVKKSPITRDVDLFILLKHGEIRANIDWLETLPTTVIEDALVKTQWFDRYDRSLSLQRMASLLVITTTRKLARDALRQSLREYYALRG
jgi:hypothetical protein